MKNNHIFAPDWFAFDRPVDAMKKGTGVRIPDSTRCCMSRIMLQTSYPATGTSVPGRRLQTGTSQKTCQ